MDKKSNIILDEFSLKNINSSTEKYFSNKTNKPTWSEEEIKDISKNGIKSTTDVATLFFYLIDEKTNKEKKLFGKTKETLKNLLEKNNELVSYFTKFFNGEMVFSDKSTSFKNEKAISLFREFGFGIQETKPVTQADLLNKLVKNKDKAQDILKETLFSNINSAEVVVNLLNNCSSTPGIAPSKLNIEIREKGLTSIIASFKSDLKINCPAFIKFPRFGNVITLQKDKFASLDVVLNDKFKEEEQILQQKNSWKKKD